ncbi:SDR family oxidoreductase [Stenotrophomonas maltophilia]|uniref:SDR family oxidoreductase n=1 Tax=Stenotrophomonas maltophilia TaxID=40324 RepID=UPI0012AFF01E|nr:SDR family oxidoreductase [Stenotrophomonas maltophilia]QGM05630.1 SDR family oxidoreductase [Stenotrophomonas maltophilia]
MKIVVIGGTGRIGRMVVERLAEQGHQVVAAAPSTGVDVLTGKGLAAAMSRADVVVDLSNSPSFEDQEVLSFFQTAGHNLLALAREQRVRHHVVLSVVGTDRLSSSGYFRGKIAQERLVRESGVPYTIIHSTQFFEFIPSIVQSAGDEQGIRLPMALVQPIASEDVAEAVARIALQAPAFGLVEIAGPDRTPLLKLVQRFLRATGDTRHVAEDSQARYFGARLAEDTLVPVGRAWLGKRAFESWLATRGQVHASSA